MDARDLILKADCIARGQGYSQSSWSRKAGRAFNGQTVSRIISRGDCRISTFLDLVEPLGYRLALIKEGEDGYKEA